MIAVDTNVVVRFLVGDDATQGAAARQIFASGPIWISATVFLETNWVLRSTYKFNERGVHDAFVRLLGLPHIHTEDKSSMAEALAMTAQGIDLADAIHLTARPAGAAFVSFDKSLISCAQRAGIDAVKLA